MAATAYLPIIADRYGAMVRHIFVVGIDLTGLAMRAQVRLSGDSPGDPLVDLDTVTNGNAEGIRLVDVEMDSAGVPTSHVELVINESTLEAMPYAGEIGDATRLAWDWQVVIAGRKRRLAKGEFEITGDGVTGAEVAPRGRIANNGYPRQPIAQVWSSASLTLGEEQVTVKIDGADLIAPFAKKAADAALSAEAARQASEDEAAEASLSAATALGAVGGVMFPSSAAGLAAVAEGAYFTVAGDGASTYAILYRKTGGVASERARYASKAAYEGAGGAGLIGVARGGSVQQHLDGLPVYASHFGIKGDGTVETAAVQAFLDWCADRQRAAYFGSLAVVIDGPIYARSVPVIFESLGNGVLARPPAFYARGANYRALTMTGACTGSYVCVRPDVEGTTTYSTGGEGQPPLNTILSDTRPKIDGILCGSEDGSKPFLVSAVQSLYAEGLQGIGVELATCWDCTFTTITTEDCGAVGKPAFLAYANASDNVNETHIVRLQTERSVGEAIVIDPRCVSLTISKIHAEGTRAQAGAMAYVLGGVRSTYSSVRMQAIDAQPMCRVNGGGSTFTSLGAENIRVLVDASGSTAAFISPAADFESFPAQNGRVNVVGGTGSFFGLNAGWHLHGVDVGTLDVGEVADARSLVVEGCDIDALSSSSTLSRATLRDCRIMGGSFLGAETVLLNCAFAPTLAGGGYTIANTRVRIDGGVLTGDMTIDTAAVRFSGVPRIVGKLALVLGAGRQAIASSPVEVTGAVTGWTYPDDNRSVDFLGPTPRGMQTYNLGASISGDAVLWQRAGSAWVPVVSIP